MLIRSTFNSRMRYLSSQNVRTASELGDIQQKITTGKEIVELSVAQGDKGSAITLLREQFRADAVTFVGDDVTDEHGFAVLTAADVGVKVGEGDTDAGFRVANPEIVLEFLGQLVQQRRHSVVG